MGLTNRCKLQVRLPRKFKLSTSSSSEFCTELFPLRDVITGFRFTI